MNTNEAYQQIRANYTENMVINTKLNSYKLIWPSSNAIRPTPRACLVLDDGEYMPDPKFSMTSGLGPPVQQCRAMMYTQISMENIFDVFNYIPGRTWHQLYVEDDPYDMGFATAKETAAAFRRDGFRPVQNDLWGSSDWHEPAATGMSQLRLADS